MEIKDNLRIGNLEIASRVILAPMAGVTDLPFRRMVRKFAPSSLVVSEMVASEAMIRAKDKTMRTSQKAGDEFPLSVQIFGSDPVAMAEAAKINADKGAALIDINMGCPVKKVVKGEAGAALMRDEVLAGRIIEAVAKAVDLPISVKMRLGWDKDHKNARNLARIAEENGARMIVVHGRTRSQFYGGEADWAAVGEVRDGIRVPLIVNGDIVTPEDAVKALEISGADGVMVGRGSYGKPWLINAIDQYIKTGHHKEEPSPQQRKELLLEHWEAMLEYYGKQSGIRIARKHLGWYVKCLRNAGEFRERVNHSDDYAEIKSMINEFFAPYEERIAA